VKFIKWCKETFKPPKEILKDLLALIFVSAFTLHLVLPLLDVGYIEWLNKVFGVIK